MHLYTARHTDNYKRCVTDAEHSVPYNTSSLRSEPPMTSRPTRSEFLRMCGYVMWRSYLLQYPNLSSSMVSPEEGIHIVLK